MFGALGSDDVAFYPFAEFLLVFGGSIPFIAQYLKIYKTRDASGFSPYVCLILIAANVLSLICWFKSYLHVMWALRSIFIIITMFIMLHICVQKKPQNFGLHTFSDLDRAYFWKYSDFKSYIVATLWFSGALVLVFGLFGYQRDIMKVTGIIAKVIEGVYAVPQTIRNYKNQSTRGLSRMMIIGWTIGDAMKLLYAMHLNASWSSCVIPSYQLKVDLVILFQMFQYRKNNLSLQRNTTSTSCVESEGV